MHHNDEWAEGRYRIHQDSGYPAITPLVAIRSEMPGELELTREDRGKLGELMMEYPTKTEEKKKRQRKKGIEDTTHASRITNQSKRQ